MPPRGNRIQRRDKPGVAALRASQRLQERPDFLVPKLAFLRLVKEITQNEWTEAYLINLFSETQEVAAAYKRVTIKQDTTMAETREDFPNKDFAELQATLEVLDLSLAQEAARGQRRKKQENSKSKTAQVPTIEEAEAEVEERLKSVMESPLNQNPPPGYHQSLMYLSNKDPKARRALPHMRRLCKALEDGLAKDEYLDNDEIEKLLRATIKALSPGHPYLYPVQDEGEDDEAGDGDGDKTQESDTVQFKRSGTLANALTKPVNHVDQVLENAFDGLDGDEEDDQEDEGDEDGKGTGGDNEDGQASAVVGEEG
ncbi:Uu.00g119890.m01.CDS01 [Anthostomella pinea]|uniref:Uu.00g119890.m01.CDS01 n=1 Tax=Anthostomella pinea TaxID=933095 RepID=A0AAI8VGP7_9PEZI|nr:Uu.00g119890.m01.CDS01 [Anthostomella pinea]